MIDLTGFDAVRVVAAAMWAFLVYKSARGCGRLLFRKTHRYYDTMRAALFIVGVHSLAFNAQWIVFRKTLRLMSANEIHTKTALYALSAFTAFICLLMLRVYERDCRDC